MCNVRSYLHLSHLHLASSLPPLLALGLRPFDQLNLSASYYLHHIIYSLYRHNDLPYNFYEKLNNHLSGYRFKSDLSNDNVWGNAACSSCYTDLPRLIKGKVGGQVSHETSHERPYEINYLRTAQPICFAINRLAILSRSLLVPRSFPFTTYPCPRSPSHLSLRGRKKVITLTPTAKKLLLRNFLPRRPILPAVRAITCESRDFSVLGGVRIVHVAIQGFPTADVTADRCDSAIHSAISGPPAIGHRRGEHRAHVEERQNSVHDRRRGRSLPRLEPGDSEALLRPRGSLRYPDPHLQYAVVRRTYTTCMRTHRIPSLMTIKFIKALCYIRTHPWKY